MRNEGDLPAITRFVLPALALCGSLFMIYAAIYAHGMAVVAYLAIFAVVMCAGAFFARGTHRP
jgi:APA family basic amino acid/polyamine antiporter